MGENMVKEHILILMDKSMWGNTRMGKEMVKEHTLTLMELSMKENGRMMKNGTEKDTTNMETYSPLLMETRGLKKELLEHQGISMKSPTETDSSWWWVKMEPSSPLLIKPLGLKGIQVV